MFEPCLSDRSSRNSTWWIMSNNALPLVQYSMTKYATFNRTRFYIPFVFRNLNVVKRPVGHFSWIMDVRSSKMYNVLSFLSVVLYLCLDYDDCSLSHTYVRRAIYDVMTTQSTINFFFMRNNKFAIGHRCSAGNERTFKDIDWPTLRS